MVRRTPPTNLPGFGGFGGREHANKAINNYCPEANRFVWEVHRDSDTYLVFTPIVLCNSLRPALEAPTFNVRTYEDIPAVEIRAHTKFTL